MVTKTTAIAYLILGILLVSGVVFILTKTGDDNARQQNHSPPPPSGDGYRPDRYFQAPPPYPRPTGLTSHGSSASTEGSTGALGTSMAPSGMDRQYSNASLSVRAEHPVLAFQRSHDKGINPANYGDPIRVADVAGPVDFYGGTTSFVDSLSLSRGSVPIPMGALKKTSERYNKDMFRFSNLARDTVGTALPREAYASADAPPRGGYQDIYGGNEGQAFPGSVGPPGEGMPYRNPSIPEPGSIYMIPSPSGDFFRPYASADAPPRGGYGPNIPVANAPFFGSVNAYAPLPEIVTPWEKAGILTSAKGNEILNLFRRAIAPVQDLWEYQVQDKNGFVIKLWERYIEDGDVVSHVIGKDGLGPWKAHVFVQNKYVWV